MQPPLEELQPSIELSGLMEENPDAKTKMNEATKKMASYEGI